MDTALNIIVVEDHDDLRAVTVAALGRMGHEVRGVDCAEALDDELAAFPADLLVLDLNLPGENGISLARRTREAQPNIGIIMVTARGAVQDVLDGYSNGADIYVTKPASPEELGAAIGALSRRLKPPATVENTLVLDTSVLQITGPQNVVDVTDHESHLLVAMAKAADHRLETWQLLEITGRAIDEPEKRALTVQIVRLRKKLIEAGAREPTIKSIRGTGYQLCIPVELR
jgi:DNA-binding response OmpR family regulator